MKKHKDIYVVVVEKYKTKIVSRDIPVQTAG